MAQPRVYLDIPILQKHNVCRDGQVQFRRKFGRAKVWSSLEVFEKDLASFHRLWNWDEAAEKFDVGEGEWLARTETLQVAWDKAHNIDPTMDDDDDDIEEDPNELPENTRDACRARAWAQLYWNKVNGLAQVSQVPKAARDYIAAVDAREQAVKFKSLLSPGVRITLDIQGYYKGNEKSFEEFLKQRLIGQAPQLAEEAIAHYTAEAERLKAALAATIIKETEDGTAKLREHEEPDQPGHLGSDGDQLRQSGGEVRELPRKTSKRSEGDGGDASSGHDSASTGTAATA